MSKLWRIELLLEISKQKIFTIWSYKTFIFYSHIMVSTIARKSPREERSDAHCEAVVKA